MNWIRLPIKLAKVSEIEKEESTGIPAEENDGQMYVREDEISHLLGAEDTTTLFLKHCEEEYVIDLGIGDVIRLIEVG